MGQPIELFTQFDYYPLAEGANGSRTDEQNAKCEVKYFFNRKSSLDRRFDRKCLACLTLSIHLYRLFTTKQHSFLSRQTSIGRRPRVYNNNYPYRRSSNIYTFWISFQTYHAYIIQILDFLHRKLVYEKIECVNEVDFKVIMENEIAANQERSKG